MPQPSYPYACARISALEKSLFGKDAVRRMAEGSLEDALRMLSDAKYGNLPDATGEDTERMIESVRHQTAQTIRELSPDPAIARWQHRLDPLEQRVADGCHLTRDPIALVEAAGFVVTRHDARYAKGPKPWTWMTSATAVSP